MVAPYSEDFPGLTGIGRMMPNPACSAGYAAGGVTHLTLEEQPPLRCRFGSEAAGQARR
jgi:hypothetical protein